MKTVFFDVDTQIDFLYPSGALYVPGAETIVPTVAGLNRHAAEHGIPVVSTMDAHLEDDPEFNSWPPHCVVGTAGQRKPAATLLEKRVVVPPESSRVEIGEAQQVLLEKRSLDCFDNPNLLEVLAQLGGGRYVVYGVVTEICVMRAALGLLKTGRPVAVVTDAVRSLNDADRDGFLKEFQASGGTLMRFADVIGDKIGA